jgi:hypothetical protein
MVVRELVAMLGVKSDKAGMKQAESGMGKLVSVAKAAAAAFAALKLVQFFKNVIKEVATLGDRFDKMSKRSGIAAEELQKLGFAAQLSGASLSDMETGIKRLQASQIEAIDGVATYADEFKRMGIEVKNQDGSIKDTTQLMVEMADGMQGLATDAERTAVATKLLGRGGAQLIPLFKEGSDAIKEMMDEMEALGGVMSQDLVEASAEWIDNQLRMDTLVMGIKNSIAKELLPFLNKTVDGFIAWWKVNGQIIRQKVGSAIKGLASALSNNLRFIMRIVKSFKDWLLSLDPMESRILKISAAVGILAAAIAAGPIGKILALATIIGLIIDDFETWREGGVSVTGAIVKGFNDVLGIDIVSWVKTGIKWIKEIGSVILKFAQELFSVQLAMAKFLITMWSDPEKAFKEFIYELEITWTEFWNFFAEKFPLAAQAVEEFVAMVLEFWAGLWGDIKTGFLDVYNSLVKWATDTITEIMKPFEKAKELIDKLTGGGGDTKVKIKTIEEQLGGLKVIGGGGQTTPRTTQARPGAQGTTVINQPNTSIQVDVKGGPGTSAAAIANEAAKKISQAMDNQNRRALKAFTPGAGA